MRVFRFHAGAGLLGGLLLPAALLAATPAAVRAQWPGEVSGRVVDAATGAPVEGASVRALEQGRAAVSDAAGRFVLTGLEPGEHELLATRLGYATLRRPVEIRDGRAATVRLALSPVALPVGGVEVVVAAEEGRRVAVDAPAASGARTAGDLLRGVRGVNVTSRGPGGPQTVSIRGSGADAVLVLLDGVPLNDPVTGEADLSTVPASALASATVLPGARSARYGPGAEAGVVLLETRRGPSTPSLRALGGSLGRADAELSAGGALGSVRWGASAEHERQDGAFDFELPASVGGGSGTRANADQHHTAVRASLDASPGEGTLGARLLLGRSGRGLPGRTFAPSPRAREEDVRTQLSLTWRGGAETGPGSGRPSLMGWVVRRDGRVRDDAPPAGLPYDDRTRVDAWGLRAEARRGLAPLLDVGAGVDLQGQAVTSDVLAGRGPGRRTDGAARATVAVGPLPWPGTPTLQASARLHREARDGWRATHEVALAARFGVLGIDVAQRSAWTPPALADLFFQEGLGVKPNPALAAERVPSEVEAGLTVALRGKGWSARLGASAYRGDVRGMVVWAPDYRFVWSPRNVDVLRRGAEASADVRVVGPLPGALLLEGSWSLAKVTYDRPDDPGVQLAYRPRSTATVRGTWSGREGDLSLEGRYTGLRYPVPAPVNGLPPFWAWDLAARRTWALGTWGLETHLRVERLLDSTDALVFGFPHPGRTVALEVVLRAPHAP